MPGRIPRRAARLRSALVLSIRDGLRVLLIRPAARGALDRCLARTSHIPTPAHRRADIVAYWELTLTNLELRRYCEITVRLELVRAAAFSPRLCCDRNLLSHCAQTRSTLQGALP